VSRRSLRERDHAIEFVRSTQKLKLTWLIACIGATLEHGHDYDLNGNGRGVRKGYNTAQEN
jgi:hypothetical protein